MRGLAPQALAVTESIELPALVLKRGEDARLRAGHLWVYSNEIDVARSPLGAFAPGDVVAIVDHRDRPIGVGYVNPNSLIAARLVSRGLEHAFDRSLIVHRLNVALALRERLYAEPYYRLAFGESDGLPGLVIDRFGDVLVGQIATAGMERQKDAITDAIVKALKPRQLWWKNDAGVRAMEQLPEYADLGHGEYADASGGGEVVAKEGGLVFGIDPVGGQKTGWFYDQRENRDLLARFVKGKRVLDMFSYLGGWGLRAAAAGADAVDCVDASAAAVEATARNIERNGFGGRVNALRADAFDHLKALREARERYDVVILDPPAFIKRRKDFKEGSLAYRRLNELGMQVLARDGLLITCSCSHHMPRHALLDAVQQGARHLDRSAQMLVSLQQAPDHPVHPAIAETDYLKGFVLRVLPA